MRSRRLFRRRRLRISAPMHTRPALLALAVLLAPATALAQAKPAPAPAPAKADGPKSIGTFQDWQAATHTEGGQTVCYALTRAKTAGAVPGRGEVVLTVTHRPNLRDAVAISAGSPSVRSSAGVGCWGDAWTIGGQGSGVARTGRMPLLRAAKSF